MATHLSHLRSIMKKQGLDAVFISSLPNILYLTNFSGFSKEDRDAFLLVTKNSQYIFTHGICAQAVKKQVKTFNLVDIKRENPISESLKALVKKHKIKIMGFEGFDLKVSEHKRILRFVNKKTLKDMDMVGELRITKSADEIKAIKKACQTGDKIYSTILQNIRTNVTEKEIAFQIELFIRQAGAEPSFPTIVAFGENASHPHHVPTNKKLKKNNFVLMDFGVKLNNYCSDMTRTVFFGKANKEQKGVYKTILESQNKAIKALNSYFLILNSSNKSVKASTIDNSARQHIINSGYPSIPHSLGHGIGLEVHEAPRLSPHSKDILTEGMVFSIEPGIYIPDKFGVRIEDLFAVVNYKLIQLTKSRSSLIEI